jgi:hypothetical protein
MKTSCISHPHEPLIIIRKAQVEFCDGNACAAALMSFFEYWHNIKLEMVPKNAFLNDIAQEHGEARCHDTSLYQFHNMNELSDGIIGLYGISSIKAARKLLVEKKIISEHKNPSGRYGFDHTIYYLFHPETYSKWLNHRIVKNNESVQVKNNYLPVKSNEYASRPLNIRIVKNNESVNTESVKITNREVENNHSSVENNDTSVEINGTITESTSEITSCDEKQKHARVKKPTPRLTESQVLLLAFGIEGKLANDFIMHRKSKRAPITETALTGFQREADKAGISIIDAIRISIEKNWAGFDSTWNWKGDLNNNKHNNGGKQKEEIDWKDTSWYEGLENYQIGPGH